jgi:hypothetical protein
MPFRTEGLGVDAGLMSFIQDTKRKTFRGDCWHVATKVPVKVGARYEVEADETDETDGWGTRVFKLRIKRVSTDGNFIIESGCENVIISDPCYILPDEHWSEFCDKLYEGEGGGRERRPYPIFINHHDTQVAASSSGYGDGYYSCNIETDDDGNLKEAYITFFTPGEEDEE